MTKSQTCLLTSGVKIRSLTGLNVKRQILVAIVPRSIGLKGTTLRIIRICTTAKSLCWQKAEIQRQVANSRDNINMTFSLFYNRLHCYNTSDELSYCLFVTEVMMKRFTAKHDKPYFVKPVRCNDSTFHWIERGFPERPEKRNKHENDGNRSVIYNWNFHHEKGKQATILLLLASGGRPYSFA